MGPGTPEYLGDGNGGPAAQKVSGTQGCCVLMFWPAATRRRSTREKVLCSQRASLGQFS